MKQIDDWSDLIKGIIKAEKDSRGIDQKDIAIALGFSQQTFSNRIRDKEISIKLVLQIFDFLKIDLMSILYEPHEIEKYLPDYISKRWAQILNTVYTEEDDPVGGIEIDSRGRSLGGDFPSVIDAWKVIDIYSVFND